MIAALFQNDLRHWLIALNFIVFIGLLIYLVRAILSPKRAREEEKSPANLTPFLPDEDLEGRRLERVQGWALIFAAVVAIALPIYWLREPTRQDQSNNYFNNASVARGRTLYANSSMEGYNAAVSLQCANCHGDKGQGGIAPTSINGEQVGWKAPPLNSELLRFSQEEVHQIITYGRPGTPMQAWGVLGGGPKNDQAISDLVAYINSIQITPERAKAEATAALNAAKSDDPATACPEYMSCPAIAVKNAQKDADASKKALDTERTKLQKLLADRAGAKLATDDDLKAECKNVSTEVNNTPDAASNKKLTSYALECGTFLGASTKADSDQAALAWATDWQSRRQNVSDGQLLFELNCARCHTEGWSVFDPTAPPTAADGISILGLSGGGGGTGGGTGFNLRDGGEMRRFGSDEDGGFALQQDFVTTGSEANKAYGILGIGTGRMPGFGAMLTADQIAQIVSYERYCLDAGQGNYQKVNPACVTGTKPRTPPTSTSTSTTVKKG